MMMTLECGHRICIHCSIGWLLKTPTCPCCRHVSCLFSKNTRSKTDALTLLKCTHYDWITTCDVYDGYPPLDVFFEFICIHFLCPKQRPLWYRPELSEYKQYFRRVLLNQPHHFYTSMTYNDFHVLDSFLDLFPEENPFSITT